MNYHIIMSYFNHPNLSAHSTILQEESLNKYSYMNIGGNAKWLAKIGSVDDLSKIMQWANENNIKMRIIGAGSNVLIDDAGWDGLIIIFRDSMNAVRINGNDIVAESGTIINIPVMIQDARNFNGFKGSIVYDPSAFSLDTLIFTDYLNNYLIEYNESAPGEIKIAASGIQSAEPNGVLAHISLLVLDGFNFESSIRLEHVMINENSSSDVGTEMMVSSELGIRGHSIPDRYFLHQNYPNPFNPTTKISYDLLEETNVEILIFDTMGRYVNTLVDDNQRAGHHSAFWNGTNKSGYSVSAGVYVYVIQAGGFYEMKKMILLK